MTSEEIPAQGSRSGSHEEGDRYLIGRLRELAALHAAGSLSAEEFADAKARLLGAAGPGYPAGAVGHPAAGHPAAGHPSPGLRPRAAAIVAMLGGGIALLAFVAMPMASVPILGSITGVRLAGFASEEGSLVLLWLVPLAAAAVVGLGGWLQFTRAAGPAARRRGSMIVLVLAGLTTLVHIVALLVVEGELSGVGLSATSLTGVGFWIALLGMMAAGIAAVADLMELSLADRSPQ